MSDFALCHGNIYIIPVLHYTMECAVLVRQTFESLEPDCVAVELAETMTEELLHAAARLPDISVVSSDGLLYLAEPCDASFEAMRSALEMNLPTYCIDLDISGYPEVSDPMPDPYAIRRIGLKAFWESYCETKPKKPVYSPLDDQRELHMARRLKELSLQHERVLFVCGMAHAKRVLELTKRPSFPVFKHVDRHEVSLGTLSEESMREVMAECGFVTQVYEIARAESRTPDRQKIFYRLLKNAEGSRDLRLVMRYMRNYALITGRLLPDLYQLLQAAKVCVDDNFAYEVWSLATSYPFRKNIDNLPELNLSAEDIWGYTKPLHFRLREKQTKAFQNKNHNKQQKFLPPDPFSICSYPPEDNKIERFGSWICSKGTRIFTEENSQSVPLSTSLEDGIDLRETIRSGKLHVKIHGKPPGPTASVVVIFDENERQYPWDVTWIGEHNQESDMAFYATSQANQVVGPGISCCRYGGFLMTYPPRRLGDIWSDPDYQTCKTKAEMLLMAAIDYAIDPVIVYVAAKPPKTLFKTLAARFGRRIAYLPIGQLSSVELNKIRKFHVLGGYDKREIADDYIF